MRREFVIFQSTAAATIKLPATVAPTVGLFEKSHRDHLLG
jgi:hypothetical protein